MKRRIQTTLPQKLPTWLRWDAWESIRQPPRVGDCVIFERKPKREKAVWRETTDMEKRAIAAYRTCYTPPWSFDRRLCRKIRDDKITDKIAAWLWFYVWKHRKQIADCDVIKEATKRHETKDSLH